MFQSKYMSTDVVDEHMAAIQIPMPHNSSVNYTIIIMVSKWQINR